MKFTTVLKRNLFVAMLVAFGTARAAVAAEPTGLELVKEANRYVGEDVKDKVVQIRSEKSIGSLTPNVWYVVYYDKDATFKTAEVKFLAGTKASVKHPMRQPFSYINYKNVLDLKKVSVDSDKAIKVATADPVLKNLTVDATRLTLERKDGTPIWSVQIWAQKLRNPNKDADIGVVQINAEDGTVIDRDLHIDRVD